VKEAGVFIASDHDAYLNKALKKEKNKRTKDTQNKRYE
jgi:hypothetical protein